MAHTTPCDSDPLLQFLNKATTKVQEALNKPTKSKKVNHTKYLLKRLDSGKKSNRKPKGTLPSANSLPTIAGRQPIATLSCPSLMNPSSYPCYNSTTTNNYNSFQVPLDNTVPPSRPPSVQDFDPDVESILLEIGLDSSPSSQYTESPIMSRRGSGISQCSGPSTMQSFDSIMPPTEYLPFSPNSEFSDIDESAYSSHNGSPASMYYPHQSPSPPLSTYYQHVTTASWEWVPTTSTLAVPSPPRTLPMGQSLMEVLELVTTP